MGLVLDALGLLSPSVGQDVQPECIGSNDVGGWGGGESPEHRALKKFVCQHPEMFGAGDDDKVWRATEEYALRSGDEIDVFFKSECVWIGVEVKSAVSDGNFKDYERGLYQIVKYRAVLLAQAKIDHPVSQPEVKVILALGNKLPSSLRTVAKLLNVLIVENLDRIEH